MQRLSLFISFVTLILSATIAGCGRAPVTVQTTATLIESPKEEQSTKTQSTPEEPEANPKEKEPQPVAVLEDAIFQFGTMESFERNTHSFVIRNDGDASLILRQGQSSCKCTIGEVENGSVPPGETTNVVLSWKTGDGTSLFSHSAQVLTNDPENPTLTCFVRGKVLARLQIEPREFSMPGVVPGVAEESQLTVSTQLWESFEISDVECSLKDASWTIDHFSDEERAEKKVNDGYRVTFKLPDNLPRGYFNQFLRMQITPSNEEGRNYEIPITGSILRRISIYGKGMDSTGNLRLGKLSKGKGVERLFSVKVRDRDPVLHIKNMEVTPDFLKVSFEELENAMAKGLYRMRVKIPENAPVSEYIAEPGKVHIEFENAKFDDLDLNVQFAIIGDE